MGLLETAAKQRTDDTALIERKREEAKKIADGIIDAMAIKAENERAVIGGNNPPPTVIESAREVYKLVSLFLADNPAIDNEESARKANEVLDQAKAMVKSLTDADVAETKPMYDEWKAAKAKWKAPVDALTKVMGELSARMTKFMVAEEEKRKAIAEEARRKAAELERIAREAEEAERKAILDAQEGEFTDAGKAMAQADIAFDQFKEAKAEARTAIKDQDVRFRSRFATKATTLRTVETLHVENVGEAINHLWPDEGIEAAILTAARAWRKAHGGEALPAGIRRTTEQKI